MRRFIVSAVLSLAALLVLTGCATGPVWSVEPDGRHRAEIREWTLRVDPAKGRLTELLPPGSTENALTRQAHVVWLGPQAEWPSSWPPPRDWRPAPAEALEVLHGGRTLRLTHPHTSPDYPRLVREYTLRRDSLDLTVRWQTADRALQAVQILQLRPDAQASATAAPSAALPHGLGHLPYGPGHTIDLERAPDPVFAIPIATDPLVWLFRRGPGDAKYGLPPRPLHAHLPDGASLTLLPGPTRGRIGAAPEAGLLTQVYLGRPDLPMVEIEQLSPLVLPGHAAGHTARLVLPVRR